MEKERISRKGIIKRAFECTTAPAWYLIDRQKDKCEVIYAENYSKAKYAAFRKWRLEKDMFMKIAVRRCPEMDLIANDPHPPIHRYKKALLNQKS